MFFPGSIFSQHNNGFHTLLRVFLVKSFIAKEMYLNAARLGFKPELPVHFST
jgi:hypothetical protein